MKKQLFGGYSVRETEVMLGVLKDENKVLQQQIAEIKRMLQANNAAGNRKKTRLPIKRVDDEAPVVSAPAAEVLAEVENAKIVEEAVKETEVAAVQPEKVEEQAMSETVSEVAEAPAEVAEPPTEVAEAPAEVAEAPAEVAEAPTEVAEALAEIAEASAEVVEAPVLKAKKVVRIKKVKAVKTAEIVSEVQPIAEVAEVIAEEPAEVIEAPAVSEPEAAEPVEVVSEIEPETEEIRKEEEAVSEILPDMPAPVEETAEETVSEPESVAEAPKIHSNLFDISMRKNDAMLDRPNGKAIEAVLPEDIDGVVCIEKSVISDIGSIKAEIAELRNRLVRMQDYLEAVQKHKAQVNNKRILAAFRSSGMSVEDVLDYLNHKNRFDVSGG